MKNRKLPPVRQQQVENHNSQSEDVYYTIQEVTDYTQPVDWTLESQYSQFGKAETEPYSNMQEEPYLYPDDYATSYTAYSVIPKQ